MRNFIKIVPLLLLAVIIGLFIPEPAQAADDYIFWAIAHDSSWVARNEAGWTTVLYDSCSFSRATCAESTIDLGATYYNLRIWIKDVATDSGYPKVILSSSMKAVWHNDSIADNLAVVALGKDSGADKLYLPFGLRYIKIRPTVSGTADSTFTLYVQGVR